MRVKTKAEIYRQSNEECARIIAADPAKYPGLMQEWASLVLHQEKTTIDRPRPLFEPEAA